MISVQFEYAVELAKHTKGFESRTARTAAMMEKYAQISTRVRVVLVHVSGKAGHSENVLVTASTTLNLGTRSCHVLTGHVCFLLVLQAFESQDVVLRQQGKTLKELGCLDVPCLFRVLNVVPLIRPYPTRGTLSLGSSPVALCDFHTTYHAGSDRHAEHRLEHHGDMSSDILSRTNSFTNTLNSTVVGRRTI